MELKVNQTYRDVESGASFKILSLQAHTVMICEDEDVKRLVNRTLMEIQLSSGVLKEEV